MTSSIEKIVEKFPHQTMQPIIGQPICESVAELYLKLNTNTALVHSNQGNSQFGLIFLTLRPEVCTTLSAIRFVSLGRINHSSNYRD